MLAIMKIFSLEKRTSGTRNGKKNVDEIINNNDYRKSNKNDYWNNNMIKQFESYFEAN